MTSIRHLKVSAGKALPQVGYSRLAHFESDVG
jgi:hypothetical protein